MTDCLAILPVLATNRVLYYLDPPDLKNLRATCRLTNSWVEQPESLRNFPISVTDETRLHQILNSSIKWSNLIFRTLDFSSTDQCAAAAGELLRKLGTSLKHVTVDTGRKRLIDSPGSQKLIDNILVHLGPQVTTLHLFGTFELGPKQEVIEKLEAGFRLPQLREVKFVPPEIYPLSLDILVPFVEGLLELCPNLVRIELPTLTSLPLNYSYPADLKNPFIAYLQRFADKPKSERPPTFLLNLSSDRDCIERNKVTNLQCAFPLDFAVLVELAGLCERIGGTILNVPITSFRKKKWKILPKCLENCIQNVIWTDECHSRIHETEEIYIPLAIQVHLLQFLGDEVYLDVVIPEKNTNLNHITITAPCQWNSNATNQEILSRLFGTVRLSVESLKIVILFHCLPKINILHDLAYYFPNLGKLHLDGLKPLSLNEFGARLFQDLPLSLEELRMERCILREEFLLNRPVQPAGKKTKRSFVFSRLENLARVKIWKCNFLASTKPDFLADLKNTFRCMNLKSFRFQENAMTSPIEGTGRKCFFK